MPSVQPRTYIVAAGGVGWRTYFKTLSHIGKEYACEDECFKKQDVLFGTLVDVHSCRSKVLLMNVGKFTTMVYDLQYVRDT